MYGADFGPWSQRVSQHRPEFSVSECQGHLQTPWTRTPCRRAVCNFNSNHDLHSDTGFKLFTTPAKAPFLINMLDICLPSFTSSTAFFSTLPIHLFGLVPAASSQSSQHPDPASMVSKGDVSTIGTETSGLQVRSVMWRQTHTGPKESTRASSNE